MQKQESSRYLTRNRTSNNNSNDDNNENDDEKNAVLSELLSDPTHESPPKRMKHTMSSPRSIKRRSFGEEIGGTNMLDAVNISMLSMESKDTAGTQLTEDTGSDCATEVSSVAMLRGWLDDFGKQSKTHYVKNTAPRVNKSLAPTTPLPPHHHAPLAIKRNMAESKKQVAPSTNGAKPLELAALEKPFTPPVNKSAVAATPLPYQAPSPSKIKREQRDSLDSSSSAGKPPELPLERPTRPRVNRSVTSQPPTPLPYNSASVIKRMMVDSKNKAAGAGNAGGGGGVSIRNKGMTPIRMKPTYDKTEVQATDAKRTSVAKLSAWLADDPTTTKKVKQIRRGANVIAKSRKFDKGLANVIVQENNIRSGSVASKKQWLEIASSTEGDSNNNDDDFSLSNASAFNKNSWLDGQRMSAEGAIQDTASAISVSDKKAWLNNAFKKADGTKTDVVTSQEERDDLSSRAKYMWRNRAPSNRSPVRRTPMKQTLRTPANRSPSKEAPKERTIFRPQTEVKPDARRKSIIAFPTEKATKERSIFRPQTEVKTDARREITTAFPTLQISEQNESPVNFHSARDKLVQRSKTNGKGVEVLSKVKIRKAKFERLQKDSRRMSAPLGLLKASWSDEGDAEVKASNTYVKRYVEDIAPQKSFEELP
jgi:hypothetical protein